MLYNDDGSSLLHTSEFLVIFFFFFLLILFRFNSFFVQRACLQRRRTGANFSLFPLIKANRTGLRIILMGSFSFLSFFFLSQHMYKVGSLDEKYLRFFFSSNIVYTCVCVCVYVCTFVCKRIAAETNVLLIIRSVQTYERLASFYFTFNRLQSHLHLPLIPITLYLNWKNKSKTPD